jgi:hypothetical protein
MAFAHIRIEGETTDQYFAIHGKNALPILEETFKIAAKKVHGQGDVNEVCVLADHIDDATIVALSRKGLTVSAKQSPALMPLTV